MTFTLDTLTWLASDAGAALLERLAGDDLSDVNTLRLLTLLRRDHSPEQAGAALELARLRAKAVGKFGADAARLFFTRDALEQASDPLIRTWRAGFFQPQPDQPMLDLCCGIGSDAFAFARAGWQVTGCDLDPVRVEMARLNAAALGLTARFEVADVTQIDLRARLLFFDPARRTGDGKRIFDVEQYQPPLSLIERFHAESWGVKVSPGVDMEQISPYCGAQTHLAFISVRGDLKEACLIYASADEACLVPTRDRTRAVLLTGNEALEWVGAAAETSLREPRQWLVEPDPALIRAGLVADAAREFGGAQLDESIAYFTTDDKPESVWVRAWRILDWMPFNGKKLQAYLRERGVGTVTVKKRGTAVTPEVLIPQLKLKGSESRTLVLTRYAGRQIVLICENLSP